MTNQNRKRRQQPSSYRAPSQAPARRGLLDSIFAPRSIGVSPMPKIRTSFARGLVTAVSTPAFVAGIPLLILALFAILLALGFQGPFAIMGSSLAVPPVGTLQDGALANAVFGGIGLFALLGLMLLRAFLTALIATVSVERMRTGQVTSWSLLRLTRVLPVTVIVNLFGFTMASVGGVLGTMLGPGIGLLVYFAAIVGGVYATAFAPAIAADEDLTAPATMQKAWRAAKMPGSGNLTLAAVYAIPAYALLVVPLPGSTIGVNPSISAWLTALGLNLLHVAIQATFVFRYLSVAPEVPEPPQPAPRTRRR